MRRLGRCFGAAAAMAVASLHSSASSFTASHAMTTCAATRPLPQFCAGQLRWASHAPLNRAVSRELQDEQSRQDRMEEPAIPQGWTLTHARGTSVFEMKKQFEDEVLEVTCELQVRDPAMAEARAAEEVKVHFPFTLLVIKGRDALDFTLTSIDNELVLDGVTHHNDVNLARDMSAEGQTKKDKRYQGPDISELDEELAQALIDYLLVRGVNDPFAEFIANYSWWLEQQEYEGWLSAVGKFTA